MNFRGSDICLLVYAMDDEQSFYNLDLWKREFLYYADIKDPDAFPFVLLGNKCDLTNVEVKSEEVESWCRANGDMKHFHTSAKDSTNVELAFSSSVERWLNLEKQLDKQMKASPNYSAQVNLKSQRESNGSNGGKACC